MGQTARSVQLLVDTGQVLQLPIRSTLVLVAMVEMSSGLQSAACPRAEQTQSAVRDSSMDRGCVSPPILLDQKQAY